MYAIPRSFLTALKSADDRLGCHYDSDLERFVITYQRPYGDPIPLMVVETEEGYFRRPAERDVQYLKRWDMENMRLKDRLDMVTSYMERYREKQRARSKDDIRHMTRENKIQLLQAFNKLTNISKANSAFRRVSPEKRRLNSTQYRVNNSGAIIPAAA